ncbi:MAG: type II secretion system protein [Myxococcales bacterium]
MQVFLSKLTRFHRADSRRAESSSRRVLERGVTLVEVMIVVAILAMVAGGATVFALPRYRDAQVKSAETWARTIRAAVQNWQSSTNETSCPTISQLVQEKHLDSGTSTLDPWGQSFTLTCTDDEIFVLSNGPDKKKGTKDDIQIPKATTAAEPGS